MGASNRAIMQHLFNELANQDLASIMELYSGCLCHLRLAGDVKGETLKQFFASIITAFPDAKRSVEDQFTDDIRVVTRWKITATHHQGDFLGIAPTGKRVTVTGISIHRISSGEIVEEWEEWDSLSLMQQLGVVPPFKFEAKAA